MNKIYIGLTDYDWYVHHKTEKSTEVNFWRPGNQPFKALGENELFLFKLKKNHGSAIVGGGFFVKYVNIPIDMAWDAFKGQNGTNEKLVFLSRIRKYREKNRLDISNPNLGCIILTETFWLDESKGIRPPEDWSDNTVTGAIYSTQNGEGKRILDDLKLNLAQTENRYSMSETKHRLGQGGFRVLVTEAYGRRCAISGEKTLPVLEAAHIKDYASNGPHEIQNGILLRSDIHTLYDKGYLTITTDYHVEVSRHLHEDFGNGKMYYQYHGSPLSVLPENISLAPAKEYLLWHNENCYLG